jgi:hypothetical protein
MDDINAIIFVLWPIYVWLIYPPYPTIILFENGKFTFRMDVGG